uniref:AAA+ ATPase domain-containing protein n=1 Tax=Rhizochromulina marina TaxID=1034831 RepID=A0A7S2RJ78_9STRA
MARAPCLVMLLGVVAVLTPHHATSRGVGLPRRPRNQRRFTPAPPTPRDTGDEGVPLETHATCDADTCPQRTEEDGAEDGAQERQKQQKHQHQHQSAQVGHEPETVVFPGGPDASKGQEAPKPPPRSRGGGMVSQLLWYSVLPVVMLYINIVLRSIADGINSLFFVQIKFMRGESREAIELYASKNALEVTWKNFRPPFSWGLWLLSGIVSTGIPVVEVTDEESTEILFSSDSAVESHEVSVEGTPPVTITFMPSAANGSVFIEGSLPLWQLPFVWVTVEDRPSMIWSSLPPSLQRVVRSGLPPYLRNMLTSPDPKHESSNNSDPDDPTNSGSASSPADSRLVLSVLRWHGIALLEQIVAMAVRYSQQQRTRQCAIHQPMLEEGADGEAMQGSWKLVPGPPRALETVILGREATELLEDIRTFRSLSTWYKNRDLAYQRVYLLYGPPGNGKTSFLQALAIKYSLSLYILQVSSDKLTKELLTLLLKPTTSRPCILALEDAESAFRRPASGPESRGNGLASSAGVVPATAEQMATGAADAPPGDPVTASDFVECIAGSLAGPVDGRLVFLTTNHEQTLPAPLLRLVDEGGRRVRFNNADMVSMRRLWRNFYKTQESRDLAWGEFQKNFSEVYGDQQFGHAQMQAYLMQYRLDPEAASKLENVRSYA